MFATLLDENQTIELIGKIAMASTDKRGGGIIGY
jgi:hypothetical protein